MIMLTRERMIELLREAVTIIEEAGFGSVGSHHDYAIPAFEVILKRLMDMNDAHAPDRGFVQK